MVRLERRHERPGQEGPKPGEEGPPQGENEGENMGFVGGMWNGDYYPPGQAYAYYQAQIMFPNGWMNGGMGLQNNPPPGENAPIDHIALAGPAGALTDQTFSGTNGVVDTFTFTLGDYATGASDTSVYINQANFTQMQMGGFGNYDVIANFEPGVDKVKILGTDGVTPITSLASANLTAVDLLGNGQYLLFTSDDDIVFGSLFEPTDGDLV